MRIAVVQHVGAGYYSDYISSLLDEAALKFKYQIKTWSNSIPAFKQQIAENSVVYILIESNSLFALRWWYAVKLKSVLKKLKPGIILDLNGIGIKNKLPQVIVLDQILLNKNNKPLNTINKLALKNFQHTLNNTKTAITYSNEKAAILNKNKAKIKTHTIHLTPPANFRKFEWHEKIMIKAMQSDNNEYFLSVLNDDVDDFTILLRGFSAFKKWQQSNMKLLLLPKYESFDEKIFEKLKTYKHRDDVKLLENLDEVALVSVFASAHSLIHFTSGFADLMVLSTALKCALPVITFKDAEIEEYMGDAAYYLENRSHEVLGNALINLYKDEKLQAQLKEAAEKQSISFNRENYKSELWQLLATAAHS